MNRAASERIDGALLRHPGCSELQPGCETSECGSLWTLNAVTLAGRDRPRLDAVSLTIPRGPTAVLGWSGAGKTSLLNLLVEFERPTCGTIRRWFGPDAAPFATNNAKTTPVASMCDRPSRLPLFWSPPDGGLWPHLSCVEQLSVVALGDAKAARAAAVELLTEFDLLDRADVRPARLSQGERSRLCVARALAARADVLVLDEPLVHVDPARVPHFRDTLRRRCEADGTALVFSTHAPDMTLALANHVVCLDEGRVLWTGSPDDLYHRPPTERLATFLGPGNWTTPDDARLWLGETLPDAICFRPERLTVEIDRGDVEKSAGCSLQVVSSQTLGLFAATELRHIATGRQRRWLHRADRALSPGSPAVLRRIHVPRG